MTTETQPTPVARDEETEDKVSYLRRWLYVWVALLLVATLAVVVMLVLIASALEDVEENAAIADRQVAAVRGNVSILPGQINTVNDHLSAIDRNLKPIPRRVRSVNEELGTVEQNLTRTNNVLNDTANVLNTTQSDLGSTNAVLNKIEGSLRDTNGTLKDTESLLVSVSGLAGKIDNTLQRAHSHSNNLDDLPVTAGAKGIYQRVAIANQELHPTQRGVDRILTSLLSVNQHLKSTCEALVPQVLGLVPPRSGLTTPC